MDIKLWLLLISFFLAIFTVFISKNTKSKYTEILAIPVLFLCSFLFTDKDPINTRVEIIGILIVSYIVFYAIIAFLYWCILKLFGHANNTNDATDLSITLPFDYNHKIEEKFIDDFPANVDSLVHVSEEIRLLTESFINSFTQKPDDNERAIAVKSYFLGICYHLASLFDSSTRVHVRILKERAYQKYVATCNGWNEYGEDMKIMSYDNKMINESFKNRCSLIKTINPSLHEDGNNRKWKNYLMFSLPQIIHDGKPVFSIGISVTRKRNDLFYFLNYCEIENIIGRHIQCIANIPEIKSFIEKVYNTSA